MTLTIRSRILRSVASNRTYFGVTRRFVCNHPHPASQHPIPDAENLPLLMINKANVSVYPAAAFAAAPAAAADWPFLGQISGSQCTCEAVWFIYLRVTQGIMTSKQRLASCTATGGRPQCPDQPLAMFRGPAHTGAGRRPN